jgi:hypothetical protein
MGSPASWVSGPDWCPIAGDQQPPHHVGTTAAKVDGLRPADTMVPKARAAKFGPPAHRYRPKPGTGGS